MSIGQHSNIAATGSDITAQMTIGNYASVGPFVAMHTRHDHACVQNPSLVSTSQLNGYPHTSSREKIIIGSDVWIGRNAVLLGGITIGHGAIIGAYSVVAKDIPPYAVVVGNPCVIKRYRFTTEQIAELLKIAWWNWPEEVVTQRAEELKDINSFIEKYKVL